MSDDLTSEEKALLQADAELSRPMGPRRRRVAALAKDDAPGAPTATAPERGPITPVQYDDDGWGDLPVQMRG